jgi:hypothetical protein
MVNALEINPTNFPPARITTISTLLNVIFPLAIGIGALLALAIGIGAGIKIITKGDNPQEVNKAYQSLLFVLLGLLLLGLSYFFVSLVGKILKVNLL